jgi:hypothetical protein
MCSTSPPAFLAVLLLLAGPAAGGAGDAPAELERRADEALVRIYGDGAVFRRFGLSLTGPEREAVVQAAGASPTDQPVEVRVASADGAVLGYAVVTDARGKDQPITVLVATDAARSVLAVEILVYREAYGGEVRRESWRSQFVGLGPGAPMRWGREIRNISGATISARSVARAVSSTVATLEAVVERLPR